MSNIYNPNLIPMFLEASNKKRLQELMHLTNLVNSTAFNFQTPVKEGKKYVVWFYADINTHKIPIEKDLEKPNLEATG